MVVPCDDGESVLRELRQRLETACRRGAGDAYELILVNDGSTDNTRAPLTAMSAESRHIVGVNLSRNMGHHLTAGLSLTQGDRLLIIDADLRDPPELLPEMMAAMDRGADVVYGQRVKRKARDLQAVDRLLCRRRCTGGAASPNGRSIACRSAVSQYAVFGRKTASSAPC